MSYNEYYKSQLEYALEYQDYIAEKLYSIGMPLFNYASKKYQCKMGENKLGVEIKHDKKYKETGNLWIELEEKSHPDNMKYVLSGINRNDNAWLYIIGNYEIIYVFSKKLLKQLYETSRYKKIENNTKTSIGFLLPKKDAQKYAAKIIREKQ